MTWVEQPWTSTPMPQIVQVATPVQAGWADDEPSGLHVGAPTVTPALPVQVDDEGPLNDQARQVIHALAALGIRIHLEGEGFRLEGPPEHCAAVTGLVELRKTELIAHIKFLLGRHTADLERLATNQATTTQAQMFV
jgi:hypothetical protein